MIAIKSLASGIYLDLTPGMHVTFTIENPIFDDDHLPVSVSTGIEFPLTPTNQAEFGFVDAMLLGPRVAALPAALELGGIEIFRGELKFDEFSDETLKYTFVQTGAADGLGLSGKIHEIESELYDGIPLATFAKNAREEKYADFGLPMIIRKPNIAKTEYVTPDAEADCSIIDKYANHLYSEQPYFVPAVKVDYLLNKILPGVSFPPEIEPYLRRLAVIGTHKPAEWQNDRWGIPYIPGTPGWSGAPVKCRNVRVAEALPEMTCVDFVIGLLKMFCATVFPGGGLRTNAGIVADTSFTDWTDKVSDIYSVIAGEADSYALGYTNTNEGFSPSKQEDLGQAQLAASVITCPSYNEMIEKFLASGEYIAVKTLDTGNIYSGKRVDARPFYTQSDDWFNPVYTPRIIPVTTMDIVYQAGLEHKTAGENTEDSSSSGGSIGFQCVRCIPADITTPTPAHQNSAGVVSYGTIPYPLRGITPIIDFPTVGSARPSTVYIGLLYGHNMLDQGDYYVRQTPWVNDGYPVQTSPLSIAIGGPEGLYEKFHAQYAEWVAGKHNLIKADVLLYPSDIADLALWQKKMIRNRLFFVKSMELTIFDEADIAIANTEFIDAGE